MKIKLIIYIALLLPISTFAQMKFKSIGTAKPIEFTFGFQHTKGAFVWYKGQKEPIALKLKSLEIDSSERESGQPDFHYYRYTEMYKGKATGEYGITEWPRNVSDIYYIRYKDGKKFKFELVEDDEVYDGKSMVLLHGIQIHYYTFYKDSLALIYADGRKDKELLTKINEDDARHINIEDYNFDGVNDLSFSSTVFNDIEFVEDVKEIFIYDSKTKRFEKLQMPKSSKRLYFSDLKLNTKNKELTARSKIGNRWISYTYRFDKIGKLALVKQ